MPNNKMTHITFILQLVLQIFNNTKHCQVISQERSTFSVPAQALALISWLEGHQDLDSSSHVELLKLLQYDYLPHSFLVSFISPCLFQLTGRTLPGFLPNMTVKPFTYFVKTDSPEEQATEKYSGVRTCFYSQVSYCLILPARSASFRSL